MPVKIRKQIYIEPNQEATLKKLSHETGLSTAEIIRQAINDHTRSIRPAKYDQDIWNREQSFIMHLIEQKPVKGKRTWQREDLHER